MSVKKTVRKSAKKKATRKATAKKATSKKAAVAHREGTIRSELEALFKKHGYADAKKKAIEQGYNKFTVQKQLYLIHTGQ